MSNLGSRLREERERLKLSQTAFAAIAGQKKHSQLRYEAGDRSPDGSYLVAIAEAGADVPYILFGRRQDERRADVQRDIAEQIAEIRRGLADSESGPDGADPAVRRYGNAISTMLTADAALLTTEAKQQLDELKSIADDPEKLRDFRIEEHKRQRAKREQMKHRLLDYMESLDYRPRETAIYMMLTMMVEYDVPVKLLTHLVDAVQADMAPDA